MFGVLAGAEDGFVRWWLGLAVVACCVALARGSVAQVAPAIWPRCIPERDGQQIGLAGSICECRYDAGGTMIRRRPGWRWACDIMQMDGSQPDILADGPGMQQGLPPGFVYAPQVGSGQPSSPGYAVPGGPRALFDGRQSR